MLIPLKITTDFSLLKSVIKIDDLITFLKENHIKTCAIVDDNLYGAMEFYHKMLKNSLKPIIGLAIKIDNYNIYLYAKNYQGYQNLLKIHTLKEYQTLTFLTLQEYIDNLKIILPYSNYELQEKFANSYLGYSNDTEKMAAMLQSEKIVYLKDVHALFKEDLKYLSYLEAIDRGVVLNNIETNYENSYFTLNVKEEDVRTTMEFTFDIKDLIFPKNTNYIPIYNPEINSYDHLYNLALKGLTKRLNNNIPKNYQKRLEYELNIIKNMGFVDYFLIVYDYVLYAKKNHIIVGPGRGSAAGSLVSYSIGITDIDPLKYDLLFERFLNPERISMPDIDVDFEYTKRGLVIDYVKTRYGNKNVAPIMTFGTLGSKQVLRDVGRVLNIKLELIDKFVATINPKESLKENYQYPNVKTFLQNYQELKKLYQISLKLEGLKRHISTHAAGVVISSVELDQVIPIIKTNDTIMTGVTMEHLENLGLLKMDFLALRNLTIIGNVLELIKDNLSKSLDLNKINLNDPAVFQLFSNADTEGIFQYESLGMKNLLQKLKPSSFSDLIAAVALFRPGPMNNIDTFIKRKYGTEKIIYLHPDLEPILKETYGIIVYQEQVMQILVKIGGYSFAEADNIRRAMSKKKEDIMLEDKNHFLTNATQKGYTLEVASSIYDLILKFANYGFNKAHSVSYALIGYQMAYLKVKFPIYFITNLLNMSISSIIKTKEYLDEARKKGIKIIKPHINLSTNNYQIINNQLRLPLSSIKNLGENATLTILKEREEKGAYQDYLDFVSRTYGKSVNKKIIISLIDASVLDNFNLTKKTMVENLDIALNYAELINSLDAAFVTKPTLDIFPEYEDDILREKEFTSYGFYISNHPVSKYLDKNIIKINRMKEYFDKHIRAVLLVEAIRTIKTKKGDDMAFITASDETGNIDLIIFPKAYYMLTNIHKNAIINVQGRIIKRYDSYQISVDFLNKI